MMSDVPVGVFLSGGVDSSTNVALMSRLVDHPVNTFSIGFDDVERYNEFSWARQRRRAASAPTTTRSTIGPDDLWGFLPDLVHHQDEPIADPVCVPLHFVARLAKQHGVTVVHVGEGADELFAGYPTYVQALAMEHGPWRRFRRLPRRCAAPPRPRAGPCCAAVRATSSIARRCGAGPSDDGRLWWGGAVAFYEQGLDRVTTPALAPAPAGEAPRDVVAAIAADADRRGARDELDRLIYQDLRLRLPELLLMRVDKLTMANAVEARVPFLDHELVELAMAHPRRREGARRRRQARAQARGRPTCCRTTCCGGPSRASPRRSREWFRGPLGDALETRARASRRSTSSACSTAAPSPTCWRPTAPAAPSARSSSGTCST